MEKEIEAKFLNINIQQLEKKLIQLGAVKLFGERLYKRCVYNLPVLKEGAWARIRDEVEKVTMTYKRVTSEDINAVEEVELVIDDFDKGRSFLKAVGLVEKAYQETKRIRYFIEQDKVEFDLDTWPGLEPWIEIEAETEQLVRKYAEKLGFDWKDARFGSADIIYAEVYDINKNWINSHSDLRFDKLPQEFSKRRK